MSLRGGREICQALGGTWHGRQGMCRCPAHDDASPSLHVTEARGGAVLVHCFAGCDQRAVVAALRDLGLWDHSEKPVDPSAALRALPSKPDEEISADEARRTTMAREIWVGASPIAGSLAAAYLRGRGIKVPLPPSLRFAPSLRHGATGYRFPCLVGAVQDGQGKIVAVQRTYLRPDGAGKALVTPAKATLGPMRDGAVRLGKPSNTIGIAEGIETALSARQLYSIVTWASLGAGRMKSMLLPPAVERVLIFADAGDVGLRCAEEAAQAFRSQGYEANIEAPETGDFNDILKSKVAA